MRRETLIAIIFAFIILLAATTSFVLFWPNQAWHETTNPFSGSQGVNHASDLCLLLTPKGGQPTDQQMQDTLQIVMSRFIGGLGVKELDVHLLQTNNLPTISIQMPSFRGNEQQTINSLLKTGELEFWDTGPGGNLTIGSTFDPSQYTQYNPGEKPLLTGHDLDSSQFGVSQEQSYNMIGFTMQDSAAKRFSNYTAQNIGHALTITLDRQVISSPTIRSQLPGSGEIAGNFTHNDAQNLVSVMKYGTLPVALKLNSSKPCHNS